MNLKNLFAPPKADAAVDAIESALAEAVGQLPKWCATLGMARRVRESISALDDQPMTDREVWADAQRVGRALDKVMPKLAIAERRKSVAEALAADHAAAQVESEQAARAHKAALIATESARSKLVAAEQRSADLQRERAGMVDTSGAAVAAAQARLQEAVAAGDLAAEQTAAAALCEAQERSRSQRLPLEAIELRLAALAKLAEDHESAVRSAERAEADARQRVHLAAVRAAAIHCDQAQQFYLARLVGVAAAMREAQAAGVPVNAIQGYSALADVRLWVGDCARSLVGSDSHTKVGTFPAHRVLACLAPVDPADLADLREFDVAAVAAPSAAV